MQAYSKVIRQEMDKVKLISLGAGSDEANLRINSYKSAARA